MKWIFGHGRPKRMANGTLAMEGQKEIVNDEANGKAFKTTNGWTKCGLMVGGFGL